MRRVDRRTNALQTDRQTDQPTDRASYRGALSHLKMGKQSKETEIKVNLTQEALGSRHQRDTRNED